MKGVSETGLEGLRRDNTHRRKGALIRVMVTIFALLAVLLISLSVLMGRGLPLISDAFGAADDKSQQLDETLDDGKDKASEGEDKVEGGSEGEEDGKAGEGDEGDSIPDEDFQVVSFHPGRVTPNGIVREDDEIKMQFEVTNNADSETFLYDIYISTDSGKISLVEDMKVGPGKSKTSDTVSKEISDLKEVNQWCSMSIYFDRKNTDGTDTRVWGYTDIKTKDRIKESKVPSCESPENLVYFSDSSNCQEEEFKEGVALFRFSSPQDALVGSSNWAATSSEKKVAEYDYMHLCIDPILRKQGGDLIYTEVEKASSKEDALIEDETACENGNEILRFANWDWDGEDSWFYSFVSEASASTSDIVYLCYRDKLKYDLGEIIEFHEFESGDRGSCENGRQNNGWFKLASGGWGKNYFAYLTSGPDKGEKLIFDRDFANLCLYNKKYSTLED